jgi:hypothetical protein
MAQGGQALRVGHISAIIIAIEILIFGKSVRHRILNIG